MSKALVVYYSLSGETFSPGHEVVVLQKGNTQRVAEIVAETIGADLFKIETVKDYKSDHYKMIKEAKEELDLGIHPELKALPEDLSQYETIYLGYPNWFNTIPNPVMTFLDQVDLKDKTIIPFATSGGGGLGRSVEAIIEMVPETKVLKGQHFLGDEITNKKEEIVEWALKINQEVDG